MPQPPPDGFLSLRLADTEPPYRFFLTVLPPLSRGMRRELYRRLNLYDSFFEQGGWDRTGDVYPNLLFVCQKRSNRKIAERVIRKLLPELCFNDELVCLLTTIDDLNTALPGHSDIWRDVNETIEDEEDEADRYSLGNIKELASGIDP